MPREKNVPGAVKPSTAGGLDKGRGEALADGVFAIALTLLVLDIKAPQAATADELLRGLAALWPQVLTFMISFAILGIFWFGHRMESHYIVRSDRIHIWISLAFLMCIAFVPFSASLLGKNVRYQAAVVIYGANLALAGLIRYVHWRYIMAGRRLVRDDMDLDLIRTVGRRFLVVFLLYLLAIGVSFVSPAISLAICAVAPVLYVVPARQSRHLTSLPARKTE
jgi:uncharacterized membrane protein